MPTVHYPFQIGYAYDEDGNLFPRLALAVSRPRKPSPAIDIDAYLDSGAERTLLDGWIGNSLFICSVRSRANSSARFIFHR